MRLATVMLFAVVVAISTIAMFTLTSCSKNGGGLFGSSYNVTYEIVTTPPIAMMGQRIPNYEMNLNIAGPAADLAVILIPPNGEPIISSVGKSDSVGKGETDSVKAKIYMAGFHPGKWVLKLKTIYDDKVVYNKEINLQEGSVHR